jgi:beta-glucosidase
MLRSLIAAFMVVTLGLFNALAQAGHAQTAAPQLGKNSLKEVVAAMTTEEKAKLLVGMGMDINIPGLPL